MLYSHYYWLICLSLFLSVRASRTTAPAVRTRSTAKENMSSDAMAVVMNLYVVVFVAVDCSDTEWHLWSGGGRSYLFLLLLLLRYSEHKPALQHVTAEGFILEQRFFPARWREESLWSLWIVCPPSLPLQLQLPQTVLYANGYSRDTEINWQLYRTCTSFTVIIWTKDGVT